MLEITVPSVELWDEEKEEFIYSEETTIQLEHSLVSISKWESKWHKAFLSKNYKTREETLDYIKCMTITKDIDPNLYNCLTDENIERVNEYIEDSMTATFFSEDKSTKKSNEIVTSELIYYWMIALNIPYEYQEWHLNRLLTLIRVCNIKNASPKRRSRREIMSRNSELNAQRRRKLNSKG